MPISKANKRRLGKLGLYLLGVITTSAAAFIVGILINYVWKYLESVEGKAMVEQHFASLGSYIPYIGIGFCVLIFLLQFYIGFWAGKKHSKIANTEATESVVAALGEKHSAELESQRQAYEKSKNEVYDTHAKPAKAELEANKWLLDKAARQVPLLNQHVFVEKETIIYPGPSRVGNTANICFLMYVRNASVYDIRIDKLATGYLKYHNEEWTGARITLRNDVHISSGGTMPVWFQYFLRQEDLNYFNETKNDSKYKDGNQFCSFILDHLKFTIRCNEEGTYFEPVHLDLKEVRIYDEEKIRSPRNKGGE